MTDEFKEFLGRALCEQNSRLQELSDEQKKMKPLPDLLIIALTLWDDKKERDVSFEFKIPILVTEYPEKKQKKKLSDTQKALKIASIWFFIILALMNIITTFF